MKIIEQIKQKKRDEKRRSRSISLPAALWKKYDVIAEENGLNISDLVEQSTNLFFERLEYGQNCELYSDTLQNSYQTGNGVAV